MSAPDVQLSVGDPEESDEEFAYEEVEVLSDAEEDDISEDLDSALRSLQALSNKEQMPRAQKPESVPGQVTRKPELVDDFIRNFLVKMKMSKTAELFELEWYELKVSGKLANQAGKVPDVYLRNAELEDELEHIRHELMHARDIAAKASATWDKFRKERDFHRMHHKRVAQEKNKLITDIKRLKGHYAKYEPTILELKRKYETAMKEKMLVALDRDKLQAKLEAGAWTVKAERGDASEPSPPPKETSGGNTGGAQGGKEPGLREGGSSTRGTDSRSAALSRRSGTPWPAAARRNPYEDAEVDAVPVSGFGLQKTFKAHSLSVANLALHPSKPIAVTCSDDRTWKMWHLPAGDLIMCGEGHKDWVAGLDFHPRGTCLASGSGDGTVKIWDFERQRCALTLTDHTQAVWSTRFHDTGDFLASASLDHSVRLWDIPAARCKQVLRGHVDSVNEVSWQPFTNNLCTGSSDKTVSVWDARSGLCTQTFYGHQNSCNHAVFSRHGLVVASGDADGVVRVWDTRMVVQLLSINTGRYPTNKCAFDASSKVLIVASDDSKVRAYSAVTGEAMCELAGHDDAVQACMFDPAGQYLLSCGSDCTFRLWS